MSVNANRIPKFTNETIQISPQAIWDKYVSVGRHIVSEISDKKMELAKIASQACNIKHGGGGHWDNFKDQHTIKEFAEEIGMNYKTLHNMVRCYHNVALKISDDVNIIDIENPTKEDVYAMFKVSDKVNKKTDKGKVRELYKSQRYHSDHSYRVSMLIKNIRLAKYFFTEKICVDKVQRDELIEYHNLLKEIIGLVGGKIEEKKAGNGNLENVAKT